MTARFRRWTALALAPLLLGGALVLAPAGAANAAPGPLGEAPGRAAPGDEPDEGGDTLLSDVLESTGRRYVEARKNLEKNKKRQLQLTLELQKAEAKRDALLPQVAAVAAQSYRNGPLTGTAFMLQSHSSNNFIERAVSLGEIGQLNGHKLAQYQAAADLAERNKLALDQAVKQAETESRTMLENKKEAERALALVGGNLTSGFVDSVSRRATPAPRNADGGFTPEGCSVNDPTTGGCITPRTLHMYKEVRKAGFTRFVGCHRRGGPFEHPKGRACDWSLKTRGFAAAHNSDMRRYGNDLMAFLVRNAERLGVLYVIWYRQIWFPATGWKSYSGPSAHTDHVHVSML
jgi:hypothetical protein